ncbi:hypothetical protein AA0119_g11570 [Alternaria tenuissima]|uniref:Uncharacterized protein n=1 Tax=Alternaria tenuissima TaxID=119927 RepID=A0AB37VZ37_9PLEO|nr:hypothetical protein AA0115_g12456 [Alternaria tenuissima]RYN89220.1 hypothetical protein AA0119_g11570 [Alternaria tenuissima]RYO05782.1 hypothetical protein AA0121_g12378 [Alternaria tenuissima]
MTDEGRQTTPEKHIDGQQQTEKVARERAGVVPGLGAEIVAKYVTRERFKSQKPSAAGKRRRSFTSRPAERPQTRRWSIN